MARSVLAAGLFRSGTNYLQLLIERHLNVDPVDTGLPKHAMKPHNIALLDGTPTVLTFKPIDKWIDSIARQSWDLVDHYDLAWEPGHTMLEIAYNTEWHILPENLPIPVSLEKLCAHYDNFHALWLERADLVISHKMAAFSPTDAICRIANHFCLDVVTPFTPITQVPMSGPFRPELYLTDTYTHLKPHHLRQIDLYRDRELEEHLHARAS